MVETLDAALPDDVAGKVDEVLKLASERDCMLTTAESCTGGLLASLLTDVTGYGHLFERGFVSYSEAAKCDLLGVDAGLLEDCGAVSREVAVSMARGALSRSGGGLAISITGFAGPGGDDDEEGLVHFACVREGMETMHREAHFGPIGRAGVRREAIGVALDMMKEALGA
jgi:nicotinamide-nucleotide amidase